MKEADILKMMESKETDEDFPCEVASLRSAAKTLKGLFGSANDALPPSILMYGPAPREKCPYTLDPLLEDVPHVEFNCIESYSPSLLFQTVLNKLNDVELCSDDNFKSTHPRLMGEFVAQLREMQFHNEDNRFVLVLENTERLCNSVELLNGLLCLQDLSEQNICVIFVSEVEWDAYPTVYGVPPISIHLPQFNKDDMISLLSLDDENSLYSSWLPMLVSVYFPVCRSVTEIRHASQIVYPHFVSPILRGELDAGDVRGLWNKVQPHLKAALNSMWSKESSSVVDSTCLELPFNAKLLVISAFLASHNPTRTDKRYFVKKSSGKKKSKRISKVSMKHSFYVLGPRAFPLCRLLAIFKSIYDFGDSVPHTSVLSHISTLVALHLLEEVGMSKSLETPKYRCTVNKEAVITLGKTVDVDLMQYLHVE